MAINKNENKFQSSIWLWKLLWNYVRFAQKSKCKIKMDVQNEKYFNKIMKKIYKNKKKYENIFINLLTKICPKGKILLR